MPERVPRRLRRARRRRLRFLARWEYSGRPRYLTWRTLALLTAPRGGVVLSGEVGRIESFTFISSHG